MKRIAIDTHVVDFILDRPGLLDAIRAKAGAADLIIITNHVIRDQLEATRAAERRRALLEAYDALPREEVVTAGIILDVSSHAR